MKRFILFTIVIAAILWTSFSVFELFLRTDNNLAPEKIFCEQDEAILQINRKAETESVDYLKVVAKNPFSNAVKSFNIDPYTKLKLYLSAKRPLLLLEKESSWKREQIEEVKTYFNESSTSFKSEGNYLLISKEFESCATEKTLDFFIEGDKKASANFWSYNKKWSRTDVYALEKGFYEYRSSAPNANYGEAVNDIVKFGSVLPSKITSYDFSERFYAYNTDTVYAENIMESWVDRGFVIATYDDEKILVSDYRSQQAPTLILLEKSTNEDSVILMDDMKSFNGFQFTSEFPSNSKDRIYALELEDKVIFTENKSTARNILIDYQLGQTLTLNPNRKEQFFGGLPTRVNHRSINQTEKESLTWKKDLLFEVNTKPPKERIAEIKKTNWSYASDSEVNKIVPIHDHLRNGTSIFVCSTTGVYKLIGPNGNLLWKGDLKSPVIGTPQVIDIFENDKLQILCRTEKSVHLIDLNGNSVGGFPYKSDHQLTTKISEFIWNGTKRILVGNEKGEIIMLNSSGQELNIIQVGNQPLKKVPFALNKSGNLRCWAINEDNQQYLGYLETPASAELLSRSQVDYLVKVNGEVKTFFEKNGTVYYHLINQGNATPISKGQMIKMTQNYFYIKNNNVLEIYNQKNELIISISLPFNEVGSVDYFNINGNGEGLTIVMDYLKNKINAYNESNENIKDFPKEGRERAISHFNEKEQILSIYTVISKSIVCYRIVL